MKTAIVHDWFVNYMGSEKCIESFTKLYPDSDIFSLVDFLDQDLRMQILKGKYSSTSFIQNLPFAKKHFRKYLALFPLAVENLNIEEYDLILSSSHSAAKGVLTNSNQLHICYCHTPMRYAWDLYHQYLKESKLDKGLTGMISQLVLHYLRNWDFIASNRVDYFIANSKHIAKRIKKVYNRDSDVIYPPVDIDKFDYCHDKENYYLTIARFVPYKKVDMIVEAFSRMPDKKLIVIGDGEEREKIKKLSSSNIEILGYQTQNKLIEFMQKAKAFVFAAEEDFGITNVEVQACGTPVIAYGVGGSMETVLNDKTGILFPEQNVFSLIEAVNKFELSRDKFDYSEIRKHSEKFHRTIFEDTIKKYILEKTSIFFH